MALYGGGSYPKKDGFTISPRTKAGLMAFHLLPKTLRDLPARYCERNPAVNLLHVQILFHPCTAAQPAQEPTETWLQDTHSSAGRAGVQPPSHKRHLCSSQGLCSMCMVWPCSAPGKHQCVERPRCTTCKGTNWKEMLIAKSSPLNVPAQTIQTLLSLMAF